MIRWRELLTYLGVAWTERGPSVTRGHIAIKCPWCGPADPSFHLSIEETTGLYNCWRVDGHGGWSTYALLGALAVRGDFAELVEAYGGAPAPRREDAKPKQPVSAYAKRWASFRPAAMDNEACAYLEGRGFWNPAQTAREFDLRVGSGRYGGRLWFPYIDGGNGVIGYTGRAMRGHQPRYFTEAISTGLYIPRMPYDTDRIILLVEGPIDALKLADATRQRYHLLTAAFCGLSLTPTKLSQLAALARTVPRLYMVLDSTVEPVAVNRLRQAVMTCLSDQAGEVGKAWERVRRLDLPPGIDDPGDMRGEQVEQWLQQTGVAQLAS